MKKFIKILLVSLSVLLFVAGCGTKSEKSTTETEQKEEVATEDKALDIMFVVTGNLGGGTNNDDVKSALDQYVSEFGGKVDTFECNMDTSLYESTLKQAAEMGTYDLIVTGFGTMVEPLGNTAAAFPDQKFLIFDTAMDYSDNKNSNVISVQVLQNQGAFLVGALSAIMTTSGQGLTNDAKTVGFVGAMESVAIQDVLMGYIEGVKYIDEEIEVLYSFVGNHTDSALTKEMALTQNLNGADIIYGVSQADLAVADAALEKDFYAICSDSDDALKIAATSKETAEHIMTSLIKDYYNMVYPIVVEIGSGEAVFGTHKQISYAEGGVKLADNEYYNSIVSDEVKAEFKKVVDEMVAGNIKVSTAYGASAEEIEAVRAKATSK